MPCRNSRILEPVVVLFGFLQFLGGCVCRNDWALQPGAGDPEVQAILREVSCRHKVVGMGAGIVRATGEANIAVVGWSKAGEETPIGLDDLWHLGSCSKAMTATLAAKLVEEGNLQWNTRLDEIFPELGEKLHSDKRGITLEQLLSHRSGLRQNPSLLVYAANLLASPVRQRNAVLRHTPRSKLVGAPGAQFSYSNFGYIVAGAMIERVAHQPFEDVMYTRLFAPMDLRRCEYEGRHPYGEGGVIWSHWPSGRPVSPWIKPINDPPSIRPAGSVRCSLRDWARFIRHHLIGEKGASDFLQAETYGELHRSRGDNYALGWAVLQRDWGNGPVFQHTGSNGWNCSIVRIAPQKGFAVFVCTNQGKCRPAFEEAADSLIALASN